MTLDITELKQRVLDGGSLSPEEGYALLTHPDKEALYEAAHELTEHFLGKAFDTCSIINAKSGNCPEDCKWCAQSGHYATGAERYALVSPSACVAQAAYNHKQGIGRFSLVASGRRQTDSEIKQIAISYRAIKRAVPARAAEGAPAAGALRERRDHLPLQYGDRPQLLRSALHDSHPAGQGRYPRCRPSRRHAHLLRGHPRDG